MVVVPDDAAATVVAGAEGDAVVLPVHPAHKTMARSNAIIIAKETPAFFIRI
jgi:hypothetical protein